MKKNQPKPKASQKTNQKASQDGSTRQKQNLSEIYAQFHVPEHVQKHMANVTRIAVFIASQLRMQEQKVDVEMVTAAAMLHDLFRICDVPEDRYDKFAADFPKEKPFWDELRKKYSGKNHGELGYDYFKNTNPVLAKIIRAHMYHCIIDPARKPKTWEEKVVSYADKRVAHDRIVSLKERLEDGHKRYPDEGTPKQAAIIDRKYFELEKEIFDLIGIDPE
jgi:uncharacterized protein